MPTGQYNCHGLVFANRRARVYELKDLQFIREDDGYREIDARDVVAGDLIVYYQGEEIVHTGIVLNPQWVGQIFVPSVLSKWGDAGEYIHAYNQCPYGTNVHYWTDRPL